MTTDLNSIITRLKARPDRSLDRVGAPFLYLDPEGILYLFQEITGLPEPPVPRYRESDGDEQGRIELADSEGFGPLSSAHLLFEAMRPVLMEKVPVLNSTEDLASAAYQYARIAGTMGATRFPDGNLNIEIEFAGIRGLLFYTTLYFNSVIRPLVADDRFYNLMVDVEALVFVHGAVRETIFYHQSYGDNKEHQWLPLVPVAVWNRGREEDG